MNNVAMAQAVQNAVKPKFHGNNVLKSKVATSFPMNLADEYETIVREYMRLLHGTLKEQLPLIRRAIAAERKDMRQDADFSVSRMIRRVMERAQEVFLSKALHFGLERKIANLANTMRKRSIREWKRIVHKTLGINILDDYYMGEFFRDTMRQWTMNNVNLIKTIPADTLTRMTNVIEGGYLRGASNAEMSRLIQESYDVDSKHADFLARDQIAKLNADVTQAQQRDAGVEEYIWSTSGDSRVRPCHASFEGKRFRWDDPPEIWYETKSKGRVMTGRRCHPGQDYQCGCVALPVFELEGLSLPWEKGEQK